MNRANLLETLGRRFARFATNVVVRRPTLWRIFRRLIRLQFDSLASRWDSLRMELSSAPYEAALEAIPSPPRRALDLGTGTGVGAFAIARRFPDTEVVGADLAERMIEQARKNTPAELASRVRFETADASRLPYDDEEFDLVALGNMIPFFDELARVTANGGRALFAFSGGSQTPIYVPFERLREELERRGFTEFATFAAGNGTSLLARKAERS
jgi:SAM-dependent methyltransferase